MTRKSDHPRTAHTTPDTAADFDDRLRLPGDWLDDSDALISAKSAVDDLTSDDVENGRVGPDNEEEGRKDELVSRMSSISRAGPQKLVQAMLALDRAKNDVDIAAARAILRVSTF